MFDRTFLVCVVLAIATQSAAAERPMRQARYIGGHPIPTAEGGGFCEIEGPHVHVFAANKLEYRPHDGYQVFVGDPVAYGYAGPRHQYKGHHAIHVNAVIDEPEPEDDLAFCYLDGPHFHAFAPSVDAEFEVVGDTYFYVAEPPPIYLASRPAMIKINAMYTPLRYERPRVVVEPPRGWIGVRTGYAIAEVRGPDVIVAPPRVRAEVYVPMPSVEINFGIGVSGGVEHRHRHDNGKHKGWGKKRGRHW